MGRKKPFRPSLELRAMADVFACKPVTPTEENTIASVTYLPVRRGSPARQAAKIQFIQASATLATDQAPPPDEVVAKHRKLLSILKGRPQISIETVPLVASTPCQKLTVAIEELKFCQMDKDNVARAALHLFLVGLQVSGRQFWDRHAFSMLVSDIMGAVRKGGAVEYAEPVRASMDFATEDAKWLTALGEKQTALSMSAEGMAELRRVGIEPIEFYLTRRAAKVYAFLKVWVKERDRPFMPTYDDIETGAEMNRNDVSAALKELREKGVLAPAAKR